MASSIRASEWGNGKMADKNKKISPEQFTFVNMGERLTDVKFDDKPIGYFKDA